MNDGVGFKKRGTILFLGGVAAVAVASWGVWTFYCGGGIGTARAERSDFAFGGWVYDREDQKSVGSALAAAGLNDFNWENGKLAVPNGKKSEYQTALAAAGVYPKAPSESRREAIREMGAFESETKTRMRELDACAFQLERTIERFSGVEYATVGVRARREQVGLIAKNIVTASVGVACKDNFSLNLDAISAITVATKHQLGVESDENISIIDLKKGKSYFGTENSVGNAVSLVYFNEKERVEKYWRLKFLETFDYIKNARISVAVDLAVSNDAGLNELNESNVGTNAATNAATKPASDETWKMGNSRGNAKPKKVALASAFEEVERPTPLTEVEESGRSMEATERSETKSVSFARLGNPNVARSVESQKLADGGNGADVSRGRIRPASFAETPELADLADISNASGATDSLHSGRSTNANGATLFGDGDVSNATFEIRSLVVRIAIPRGYVRRVAQNLTAETTSNSTENATFDSVYQTTEQKILDETKRVALKMLQPIQERNRWDETETANWIDVSIFSDVDENEIAKNTFQNDANRVENRNVDGENWRVLGNFADVSERIAEKSESVDEPSQPSTGSVASFFSRIDVRSPFFWGGVGSVFVLAAGVGAASRRKNRKNKEKKENRRKKELRNAAREMKAETPSDAVFSPNGRRAVSENRRAATINGGEKRNDSDLNDCASDLDDDLEIEAFLESARKKTNGETRSTNGTNKTAVSSKRREALDFVSRNPDRAATALNRWIKPNV